MGHYELVVLVNISKDLIQVILCQILKRKGIALADFWNGRGMGCMSALVRDKAAALTVQVRAECHSGEGVRCSVERVFDLFKPLTWFAGSITRPAAYRASH